MTGGKVEKRPKPVSDPSQTADKPPVLAGIFEACPGSPIVGSKASPATACAGRLNQLHGQVLVAGEYVERPSRMTKATVIDRTSKGS
jgi:hypothetical protein